MATRITALILRKKADLAEDAFFGLDRVIKRTDEYNINLQDFEVLRQAHVLLGRISIKATAESDKETDEFKKSQKTITT